MTDAEADERVKDLRDTLGYSEVDARFVVALEQGEIDGDVVEVPDRGED